MNEEDEGVQKVIDLFTNKLNEISKAKSGKNRDPNLVDAIFFFHNIINLRPDLIETNRRFAQLSVSLLEATLNFFTILTTNNQLINAILRDFIFIAKHTHLLPSSIHYIDLVIHVILRFPDFSTSELIPEFFSTVFQFPNFISSFFFDPSIEQFIFIFFFKESYLKSSLIFIDIFKKESIFPNNLNSNSFYIINFVKKTLIQNVTIPKICIENTIIFISIYLRKIIEVKEELFNEFFNNNHNNTFDIFYNYLKVTPNISLSKYFSILLTLPNNKIIPNNNILRIVYNEIFKEENCNLIKYYLFYSIYLFILNNEIEFNIFKEEFPLQNIINKININENNFQELILNIIQILTNKKFESSIDLFIEYLNQYKSNLLFQKASIILNELIEKNEFKLSFKQQQQLYNFYEDLNHNEEIFEQILIKYRSFQALFLILYQNYENKRKELFLELLKSYKNFDDNNLIFSIITFDNNSRIIQIFLNEINNNSSKNLFLLLINLIKSSNNFLNEFLNINGFLILEQRLNLIKEKYILKLLKSFLSNTFQDKLNETLLSLNITHILYKLNIKTYQKLIFGKSFLQLPVFIPMLKYPPIITSQFDIINFSKYSIPIYLKLNKNIPNLYQISNRYITKSFLKTLIRKQNINFEELIDIKKDHFPIYEFLPYSNHITIKFQQELENISFWFKITKNFTNEFQIFQSKTFTIIIKNEELQFLQNSIMINHNKWYFISIMKNKIYVNNNSYQINERINIKEIIFGSIIPNNILWSLSFNIREISNYNEIENLYKKGPNYLIIDSTLINLPKNNLFIPYYGFSYYLQFPYYNYKFIQMIKNCNEENKFLEMFSTLINYLKVNNNNNNNNNKIFYNILNILNDKKEFIKEIHLNKLINYLILTKNLMLYKTFLYNYLFWENISKELLKYLSEIIYINIIQNKQIKEFINDTFELFVSLIKFYENEEKRIIIIQFLIKTTEFLKDNKYLIKLILVIFYVQNLNLTNEIKIFFLKEFPIKNNLTETNLIIKLLTTKSLNFNFNIFELLYKIQKNKIEINFPKLINLYKFLNNKHYFYELFSLLTDIKSNYELSLIECYSNQNIKYPNILPNIILLIFISLIILIYSNQTKQNINEYLSQITKESIELLLKYIQNTPNYFQNNKEIINIIEIFCPLIPNILNLKHKNFEKETILINQKLLNDKFNNIINEFELNESLKTIILKSKTIQEFPRQEIITKYKNKFNFYNNIQKLLKRFNLKIIENNEINYNELTNYLNGIKYTEFVVYLILNNLKQFPDILFEVIYFYPFQSQEFINLYCIYPIELFFTLCNNKNYIQNDINLFEQILLFLVYNIRNNILIQILPKVYNSILSFINRIITEINIENNNILKLLREIIYNLCKIVIEKNRIYCISILINYNNIFLNKEIFNNNEFIVLILSEFIPFLIQEDNNKTIKLLQMFWPNSFIFSTYFIGQFTYEVYEIINKCIETEENNLIEWVENSPKIVHDFISKINEEKEENKKIIFIQNLQFNNFKDLQKSYYENIKKNEIIIISNKLIDKYYEIISTKIYKIFNQLIFTKIYRNSEKINIYKEYVNIKYLMIKNKNILNQEIYYFSQPFWPSRVITPFYNFNYDKQKFIKTHPVIEYLSFNSNYNEFGEIISQFNCKFLYLKYKFDSIVFIYKSYLLILINSNLINNNNQMIFYEHQNDNNFNEIVNNFGFSNFSYYFQHPLLILSFSKLIYYNTFDNNIQFYFLNSNTFIINCIHDNNINIINNLIHSINLNIEINSNFIKFNELLQPKKLITYYKNNFLSTFEFLIYLNGFNNHSFINKQKDLILPKPKQITKLKTFCSQEIIYPFYYCSDFLNDNNNNNNNNNQIITKNISFIESNNENFMEFLNNKFNIKITNLIINKQNLIQKIQEIINNKNKFLQQENNQIFHNFDKDKIILSTKNNFLIFINEIGVIDIFHIIYMNFIPKLINPISNYIIPLNSKISINEHDLIGCIVKDNKIIIFDIIRGFTLRRFEISEIVNGSEFNEKFGYIVFWNKSNLYLYSINGTFITKYEVSDKIIKLICTYDKFIVYINNENKQKFISYDISRNSFMNISKI